MINKFPHLTQIKTKQLIQWLKTQADLANSDALKYRACGNESEYERHRAKASTHNNIIIHLTYHMKDR